MKFSLDHFVVCAEGLIVPHVWEAAHDHSQVAKRHNSRLPAFVTLRVSSAFPETILCFSTLALVGMQLTGTEL